MLPLLQVVTKNNRIPRKASIFLEQMFIKYGIDSRTIVYADLTPLFKDAPGFIIKKFELDKKLSAGDLKKFKTMCGGKYVAHKKPAPPVTTSTPPAPPPSTTTITTTTSTSTSTTTTPLPSEGIIEEKIAKKKAAMSAKTSREK